MSVRRPRSGPEHLEVLVPVHDERQNLPSLVEALERALDGVVESWSLLAVDDGSRDGSFEVLAEMAARDRRVRAIKLSRNFGHQAALACALDHAALDRGEAEVLVVTMDADLQHPPEQIEAMVEAWRAGHDVVCMVKRTSPGRGALKALAARLFYFVFNRVADVELSAGESDFRLLDARCARAIRALPERRRFLRGLARWIGFSRAELRYAAPPRRAGEASYTLGKLARLAALGFTSFATAPPRAGLWLGALTGLLAFGLACTAPLWIDAGARPLLAATLVAGLFVSGAILACLGIVGAYVAALLEEARGRPAYVIEDAVGLEPEGCARLLTDRAAAG